MPTTDWPDHPKAGDKRFSAFFGNAFVVLTRYVNDRHWYFYRENDPKKTELRAETPWSQMPEWPT
jgi:hypothetical protein